jgi:hypothetical protein
VLVLVAVWASDTALVAVLEMFSMGVCASVGGDVVMSVRELGHVMGAVVAGLGVGVGCSSSGGSVCRVVH